MCTFCTIMFAAHIYSIPILNSITACKTISNLLRSISSNFHAILFIYHATLKHSLFHGLKHLKTLFSSHSSCKGWVFPTLCYSMDVFYLCWIYLLFRLCLHVFKLSLCLITKICFLFVYFCI